MRGASFDAIDVCTLVSLAPERGRMARHYHLPASLDNSNPHDEVVIHSKLFNLLITTRKSRSCDELLFDLV